MRVHSVVKHHSCVFSKLPIIFKRTRTAVGLEAKSGVEISQINELCH